MTTGFAVLLGALVLALIAGTAWKLTYGRMRKVHIPDIADEPGAGGASADAEAGAGPAGSAGLPGQQAGDGVLSAGQLGHPLGERAPLLQFSSAFCAPCRATRRILADVAGMTEGVAHIEVDAESRLDLVRQLNVLRTPTVLVLAADGSIVRRASGQPRKPDVIAAIGEAAGRAGGGPLPTYVIGIEDSDSSSQRA